MEYLEAISDKLGTMNGFFTFVFLIFFFTILFFKKLINKYFENQIRKKKVVEHDYKSLKYHTVFLTCEKVKKAVSMKDFTTNEDFDKVKSALFKLLIELKMQSVSCGFKDFLEDDELPDATPQELIYKITSKLSAIINDYNDKAFREMTEMKGIEVKDARYLIDEYEKFRHYMVQVFSDNIEKAGSDESLKNNFEKLNVIFYLISMSLGVVTKDVELVFDKVNGRFKKYNLERA